jgi:hypothetical protein
MTDSLPPYHGVYAREEVSPDGVWRVAYVHVDGERSPTIIEPRVTHVPSGRVVVDMWRSSLHGGVDELTHDGFRLTVRDPYGVTVIVAKIDLTAGQFVLADSATAHPLGDLDATVSSLMENARAAGQPRRSSAPPALTDSWRALVALALFVVLALIALGFCA